MTLTRAMKILWSMDHGKGHNRRTIDRAFRRLAENWCGDDWSEEWYQLQREMHGRLKWKFGQFPRDSEVTQT